MYCEDRGLSVPDDAAAVWRYVTFTKFLGMLTDGALFFCRLDKLHDQWEGVYPKAMLEYWSKTISPLPGKGKMGTLKELLIEEIIPSHFINCWYVSEYESDAMWRLYSRDDQGIAIKSTMRRLKKSFDQVEQSIRIGRVNYIDYDQWQPHTNSEYESFLRYEPFFLKRLGFKYENELRALVELGERGKIETGKRGRRGNGDEIETEKRGQGEMERRQQNQMGEVAPVLRFAGSPIHRPVNINNGLKVRVDLRELIEAIYVFPDSKDWFVELVGAVLDKYGYEEIEVRRSSLGERPWGKKFEV